MALTDKQKSDLTRAIITFLATLIGVFTGAKAATLLSTIV